MRAPQLIHPWEKPPSIGGSILRTTVLPQFGHVTDTVIMLTILRLQHIVSNQSRIRQRDHQPLQSLSLL